jgi:hypothetical protein
MATSTALTGRSTPGDPFTVMPWQWMAMVSLFGQVDQQRAARGRVGWRRVGRLCGHTGGGGCCPPRRRMHRLRRADRAIQLTQALDPPPAHVCFGRRLGGGGEVSWCSAAGPASRSGSNAALSTKQGHGPLDGPQDVQCP